MSEPLVETPTLQLGPHPFTPALMPGLVLQASTLARFPLLASSPLLSVVPSPPSHFSRLLSTLSAQLWG